MLFCLGSRRRILCELDCSIYSGVEDGGEEEIAQEGADGACPSPIEHLCCIVEAVFASSGRTDVAMSWWVDINPIQSRGMRESDCSRQWDKVTSSSR